MRLSTILAGVVAVGLTCAPGIVLAKAAAPAKIASTSAGQAYYTGNVQTALNLAANSGDRWIGGLASYRTGQYPQAQRYFTALSADAKQSTDLRAAAAFWAARSAAMQYDAVTAEAMLKVAAKWPATFYGVIADRHVKAFATPAPVSRPSGNERFISFTTGPAGPSLEPAFTEAAAGASSVSGPGALPVPQLFPAGGFTIYPALVYALVRQESGFKPTAVSSAGAVGLMQLMPATARQTANLRGLASYSLTDSSINLRLGQDYVAWLVNSGLQTYDMLCAVAAYNGGPGTVTKVATQLGGYGDSLMIMESMPAKETRDYVKKVMVNYWTYARQFGSLILSLDALASGYGQIDIRMDTPSSI